MGTDSETVSACVSECVSACDDLSLFLHARLWVPNWNAFVNVNPHKSHSTIMHKLQNTPGGVIHFKIKIKPPGWISGRPFRFFFFTCEFLWWHTIFLLLLLPRPFWIVILNCLLFKYDPQIMLSVSSDISSSDSDYKESDPEPPDQCNLRPKLPNQLNLRRNPQVNCNIHIWPPASNLTLFCSDTRQQKVDRENHSLWTEVQTWFANEILVQILVREF